MDFESQLRSDAASVEEVLDRHLAISTLANAGIPDRLSEAMRYAVLGGGKRFRPFLTMEAARLFEVSPKVAVEVAAAFELVHCYSLVHDDLPAMDDDRMRRGQPTVWAAFDEWTAILAGDALLTLAFELLGSDALAIPRHIQLSLVTSLARAAGPAGMVGGQQLDLDVGKRKLPSNPTLAFVEQLQAMKTGALFALAAEAGAILGSATQEHRAALHLYGKALGLAFQITDDLLDVEGDCERVGKSVAKDAAAGKATLVGLLGQEEARRRVVALTRESTTALSIFGARAVRLREVFDFATNRDR